MMEFRLEPFSELRFEILSPTGTQHTGQTFGGGGPGSLDDSSSNVKFQLTSGTAEVFGCEMSPSAPVDFCGSLVHAQIFTWHGCRVKLLEAPAPGKRTVDGEYVSKSGHDVMQFWYNVSLALRQPQNGTCDELERASTFLHRVLSLLPLTSDVLQTRLTSPPDSVWQEGCRHWQWTKQCSAMPSKLPDTRSA